MKTQKSCEGWKSPPLLLTRAQSVQWFSCLFFIAFAMTGIDQAYASSTPMQDVLCTIIGWFMGNLGEGLATIGLASIGVGACLGKTSWGLAFTVGTGISVMFGASTFLQQAHLIGGNACP